MTYIPHGTPPARCKFCGRELSHQYISISSQADKMYVIVVNDTPKIMRTGDSICGACSSTAEWYKKGTRV